MIFIGALALGATGCGADISEAEFKTRLTADGLINEQQAQCIVDGLGAAGIALQSVTDDELGDDSLPEQAQAVVTGCMVPGQGFDGTDTDAAQVTEDGVGDPTLDMLYADCESGNGLACDALYFQSPLGSRYERFARLCGDRVEMPAGLCAEMDLE